MGDSDVHLTHQSTNQCPRFSGALSLRYGNRAQDQL